MSQTGAEAANTVERKPGTLVLYFGWLISIVSTILGAYGTQRLNDPDSVVLDLALALLYVPLLAGVSLFLFRRWFAGLLLIVGGLALPFLGMFSALLARLHEAFG